MLLEVDRIHSFYGSSHVLHGVSVAIDTAEVVALLGRNGVGKSTTLKSIIGIVRPRQGHVRLRGEEVTGRHPYQMARRGVAYVPEERRIFGDLTVAENLQMGALGVAGHRKSATWTTERIVDLFPNLGERMANLGRQLSGGEQQMLAIARGLMSDPEILLLDEPSEGLAPVVIDRMQDAMHRLKQGGVTILLAEQGLEFVKGLAVRSYVLDKGVVTYTGPIQELLDDPKLAHRHLAV